MRWLSRVPPLIAVPTLVVWLGVALSLSACSPTDAEREASVDSTADSIPPGTSSFVFDEYAPLDDKPLTVWTFAPDSAAVDKVPIVFVLHGFGRNGKGYRDDWVRHARENNFLLVVPTFSEKDFPGGDGYNLGSLFTESGDPVPEPEWAYSALEPLFDHVKRITGSEQDGYFLYGHSAGSQVAHRFLLFKPENRARTVVAANAGWYTMPSFETGFPYGLKDAPTTPDALTKALGQRLIVHLGEEDDDPNAGALRTTPEAMAQGAHRVERGHTFYRAAQKAADSLGVPFNWTLRTVPDVGHDNEKMAADAASLLFGEPDAE